MKTGAKVGCFLAGLVLVGLVGAGVGTLAGPIATEPAGHDDGAAHSDRASPTDGAAPTDRTEPADDGHGHHGGEPAEDGPEATDPAATTRAAPGTSATQDGYRLVPEPTVGEKIHFQVLDPEAEPVVETEIVHERPLHLILVGITQGGYAHLHPEVNTDGTWSVALPDVAPDAYRMVADLTPGGGPALVLAGDIAVPGELVSRGGVPVAGNPTTVDGITVTFDGHPEVGDTELAFTATRDGQAIAPEPYLGARGHLVAFRAGDLAYSHVHPGEETTGPVRFVASFPSERTYRLFLDLQVDGVVRTFGFTVEVHGHGH